MDVTELLARHARLKDARRTWESHWQELAEVMLPKRADFTTTPTPGAKRTESLFDGTAMQAARGLASSLDGLLKPKSSKWISLRATDDALNEDEAVQAWMAAAEDVLWREIYHPRARFQQRSAEVDLDLCVLGTGFLFVGETRDLNHLNFRAFHPRQVVISENADGAVDTAFITEKLSARQAAQKFGKARLGKRAEEAFNANSPDTELTYVQAILPRDDALPGGRDARRLPFASLWIEVESEHVVSRSGYHEFPLACPRWDMASGEIYGRSPGMIALADARTLQQMSKTLLEAAHKQVDPPLFIADDSIIGAPRTYPGGITYYDSQMAQLAGGNPVYPLRTGANVPLGLEMEQQRREQIMAAFFRNVLQLPVDGPAMTATEVVQRREEFIRVLGPVFGRLEADYLAPVVERAFAVLARAGRLPPPPPTLQGGRLAFEFASPVEKAKQQIEAAGAARAVESLAPFIQANPALMDLFDDERITREVGRTHIPQRWMRSPQDVQAKRAELEQAAQQQALGDLAGAIGPEALAGEGGDARDLAGIGTMLTGEPS